MKRQRDTEVRAMAACSTTKPALLLRDLWLTLKPLGLACFADADTRAACDEFPDFSGVERDKERCDVVQAAARTDGREAVCERHHRQAMRPARQFDAA
jgi:hypothetical protein